MTTFAAGVSFRSFGLAKAGNTDADWQDAAAHSEAGACFAVADGARSASSSGLWSHLLTRGFLCERFVFDDREDLARWLQRRAREWHARTAGGEDEPSHLQQAQGSHATLLTVELVPEGRWQAVAIGDSCLLHYRRGELISSFPIGEADAFGFSPDLVATDRDTSMLAQRASGGLRAGDVLVAATAAAAEWMIRHAGSDDDPAPVILADDSDLRVTLIAAREAGRLRNDDVALVRAALPLS